MKKKLIIPVVIGLSFALLGLAYSFIHVTSQQTAAVDQFSKDNITLNTESDLTKSFTTKNKNEQTQFKLKLKNTTEHSYNLRLDGSISINNDEGIEVELAKVESVQTIKIAANTDREIEVKFELPYFEEALLNLDIFTEITVIPFINIEQKSLQYSLPIKSRLLADDEIVKALAIPQQTEVVFDPAKGNSAHLNTELKFNNYSDIEINSSYWELQLLSTENKLVQILSLDQISLAPNTETTSAANFTFDLPPANQLAAGSQQYKLQLNYKAEVNGRIIATSHIPEQTVKITVVGI